MRRREQKGAALLTVLLLTATLAVLAVGMTEILTRSLARAAAAETRDRAFWTLRGIEEVALRTLRDRADEIDDPSAPLFREPIVLPLGEATATVSFREASNCFNVNDLVDEGPDGGTVPDEGAQERFARLVSALGGNASAGEQLAGRIADFLDNDRSARPGGAEDFDYARRDVPYRTPGALIASVTEVRAIAGFSRDVYRILAPRLCATPTDGTQALNVNTLTPADAPLLAALAGDALNRAAAERLIESRPEAGYEDVPQFLAQPLIAQADLPAEFAGFLATTSGLVAMEVVLENDQGRLREELLIDRTDGVEVIERRVGERLP